MNLMFWKKKTSAGAGAENARENLAANTKPQESLDYAAAKQDTAGHNPDSHKQESSEPETPAKPGLIARIKLWPTVLTRHFKKTPAFRAEEGHVPDAPGSSKKPDDAAAMEPDPQSPDLEAPGLESPDTEAPAKPGLAARVKLQFIALTRRFRKMPAPDASDDREDTPGRSKAAHGEDSVEDAPELKPARSRKPLLVGGAIGLLILLLAGIGFVVWPYLTPPPTRSITRHDVDGNASGAIQAESAVNQTQTGSGDREEPVPEKSQTESAAPDQEPASEIPQTGTEPSKNEPAPEKLQTELTEIEALKKRNAELQAQIEALKKKPPQQQSYIPSARHSGGNGSSSAAGGELTVGSESPQSTAMTLKEAIEAMNASSGDRGKKPAK